MKFLKEGAPQVRALRAEMERSQKSWKAERMELESAINELNEKHSEEFMALQQDKAALEVQLERMTRELEAHSSTNKKAPQNVIVVRANDVTGSDAHIELKHLREKFRHTQNR